MSVHRTAGPELPAPPTLPELAADVRPLPGGISIETAIIAHVSPRTLVGVMNATYSAVSQSKSLVDQANSRYQDAVTGESSAITISPEVSAAARESEELEADHALLTDEAELATNIHAQQRTLIRVQRLAVQAMCVLAVGSYGGAAANNAAHNAVKNNPALLTASQEREMTAVGAVAGGLFGLLIGSPLGNIGVRGRSHRKARRMVRKAEAIAGE